MTDDFRELLNNFGLLRVATEIERVAQPSIRLVADKAESQLALGVSRLGGNPDLPIGIDWPEQNGRFLLFIAQINLAEITPYHSDPLMPTSGMLYFFFDIDQYYEPSPSFRVYWKIWFFNQDVYTLQRVPVPAEIPLDNKYNPCSLILSTEITLPAYSSDDNDFLERLGLSSPFTNAEGLAYENLQSYLAGMLDAKFQIPIHRFLGHPDPVQWDVQRDCYDEANRVYNSNGSRGETLKSNITDWKLLLQVDSDNASNTMWGDVGRIYFFVRKQDLLELDFSKVWLVLQCT